MKDHALWCPALLTPAEAEEGRTPGRCTCAEPPPPDKRTRPLFPGMGIVADPEKEGEGES